MAQVSKKFLPIKVTQKIEDVFLRAISGLQRKEEIVDFLNDFLTPTERIMLSKRLSIAFLVAKNYDHRRISGILKVSTATVRSVSFSYKNGSGYKRIVDKILGEDRFSDLILDLAEDVSSILGPDVIPGGKVWKVVNRSIKLKKKEKPF